MSKQVTHQVLVEMIEYPEGAMFLQQHVGEATFEDGRKVSIGVDVGSGATIFSFFDDDSHPTYAFRPRSMLDAILNLRREQAEGGES